MGPFCGQTGEAGMPLTHSKSGLTRTPCKQDSFRDLQDSGTATSRLWGSALCAKGMQRDEKTIRKTSGITPDLHLSSLMALLTLVPKVKGCRRSAQDQPGEQGASSPSAPWCCPIPGGSTSWLDTQPHTCGEADRTRPPSWPPGWRQDSTETPLQVCFPRAVKLYPRGSSTPQPHHVV